MDEIARYGAYLTQVKHASPNTVSSYLRDVTQFAEYLRAAQHRDLPAADSASIENYMRWMHSRAPMPWM